MFNQVKRLFLTVCVFCFMLASVANVNASGVEDWVLVSTYLNYVKQEQALKAVRDAKLSSVEGAAIINGYSSEEQDFKTALGDFRVVTGSWGIKNAKFEMGASSWGTIFLHTFKTIKTCPGVDLVFLLHELDGQIEQNANASNCRQSGICFVLPFDVLDFKIREVNFKNPFLLSNAFPVKLMGSFFRRIEVLHEQGKLTPESVKLITKFVRALVAGDCDTLEKMQETWKMKTAMVVWRLHWIAVKLLGDKAPDPIKNPIFHFRPIKADCVRGPVFAITTKTGKRFAYTFRLASFIEGGKAFCKRIKGKNWKGIEEVKIPTAR